LKNKTIFWLVTIQINLLGHIGQKQKGGTIMSLSCSLRFETRLDMIQSLQLIGGATASIFPQVEALLSGDGDYQSALKYVAARKKMDRYETVMDFLFCELHPEWRMACRRFYAGNGPQLKDQITPRQLVRYNERLLKALEVAHDIFCEQRRESWRWYYKQVNKAIRISA